MKVTAEYLIKKFNLKKHPEGGYYIEVYRSEEFIEKDHLPKRYDSKRSFSTSIYFLLKDDDFSSFHRVMSDEIWHFYAGTSLSMYIIKDNGELEILILGKDNEKNESYFGLVKKGNWFAAKTNQTDSYTLVGCTVAPGFDFADFQLAERQKLIEQFPKHKEIITQLTRET